MHWLLIGYMFLFIHRPFEVWPWLGELRVERIYMLVTLAVWLVHPGKRWLPNVQHAAFAAFAAAVLFSWAMSPWADRGQPQVEDYFKIVVFYVLLVTCVHDERGLRRVAVGFLAVMALYLAHSLREYVGGRHTFRMGIARMIGVDSTLGDPNSFGAGILFSLPFVPALWRAGVGGRVGRGLLAGYLGLAVLCLLLTGSRSSLVGLVVWGLLQALRVRRSWLWLLLLAAASPFVFLALPESLQTRFETIIDPEVGPRTAQVSGEGRIQGFFTGLELWAAHPLTGIGPGAWRAATGSYVESHNLYGQLLGETGTVGAVAFLFVLGCYLANLRRVRAARREHSGWSNDLVFQVASAVGTGLFLLLLMGNFGHNLFRFTWLWYGGFLIIATHCVRERLADPVAWLPAGGDRADTSGEDATADGWVAHPAHAGGNPLGVG
jgi:O-antigen ligase